MTVRARLTLWYSGLLVLIVAAFALGSYVYLDRLERDRIDRMLHEQSEIVVQSIASITADRSADGRGNAALLGTLHDLRARGIRAWIFEDDGTLRVSTDDVDEGEGPDEERSVLGDTVPIAALRRHALRRAATLSIVDAGADGARLLTTPLPADVGGGMLLVSYPLREVSTLLARARRDATIAIVVALIVSLGAGYLLARSSMAPVAAMSNRAAVIGAANVHERLPVYDARDELGMLATTFNALLDRVAEALEQQRRFMADASHELRTPVAILRGETDIALRRNDRTAEQYREALGVVQVASERLGHTVEDIFLLALVDAKAAPVTLAPLYLNDLMVDGCRAMRSLAEARGTAIDWDAAVEAPYVGDERLLARLIANLLDNAIKYSSSRVAVLLERRANEFVIDISNDGPGIPDDARAHVFDRFFRVDAARTAAVGESGRISGSGLGLPIARWIAEQHGGTLVLSEATAEWTTFTVRLPRTPPSGDPGFRGASSQVQLEKANFVQDASGVDGRITSH
jgi:signal transduction histidine kinase